LIDDLSFLDRSGYLYSYWIGLHDIGGESLYKWSDGTGYGKFIYWNNGEPNDMHGQEDCVTMARSNGKWNDNHCSKEKAYICKSRTGILERIFLGNCKPTSLLHFIDTAELQYLVFS
jgi:hypothetical protein